MPSLEPDLVDVQAFNRQDRSLLFRCSGRDRVGLVAQVTGILERNNLYVDSISFNLVLPRQDHYEMDILARGALTDLQTVETQIQQGQLFEVMSPLNRVSIYWPTALMSHIAIHTPDREGIIAKLSEIVGEYRDVDSPYNRGSFVHLLGMTHNSDGPEGGTAYFSVRANVACQSLKVQQAIAAHVLEWAQAWNFESGLNIVDLNALT